MLVTVKIVDHLPLESSEPLVGVADHFVLHGYHGRQQINFAGQFVIELSFDAKLRLQRVDGLCGGGRVVASRGGSGRRRLGGVDHGGTSSGRRRHIQNTVKLQNLFSRWF